MKDTIDMFPGVETRGEKRLDVLPVSVIDIDAHGKREEECHSRISSRENFSPFPREVSSLCAEFFLKNSGVVFDPFAGWGERHSAIKSAGKKYIGYDTSPDAIKKAKEIFGVDNILADSLKERIPEFDGLLTCPPYWNLEKYAAPIGLDREPSWDFFIESYAEVLHKCWQAASRGSVFCIMVGDWRSRGVYYDLTFQTERILGDLFMTVIDKIVVSRKRTTKIKIMLPQCKRLGYTVHVHENLLVYKKP